MSEWISVKERLPEFRQAVLLWPNTVGAVGYGCRFEYAINGGGFWCDWEDHTEPWEPTHWMPLPEPPKTEGE